MESPDIVLPANQQRSLPAHRGEKPLPRAFWKGAAVSLREEAWAVREGTLFSSTQLSPQQSKAHSNVAEFVKASFCVDWL